VVVLGLLGRRRGGWWMLAVAERAQQGFV